jgi:general secretion pathway protein J
MRTRRTSGFTLVELLVALFITAILFAMGYGALSQALNSRKEVEDQTARLTAVQQTIRIMEQDIELMQPRPARDPLGNGYEAPLVINQNDLSGDNTTVTNGGGSSDNGNSNGNGSMSATVQGGPLITFTRGGWANPAGLPRSELQRVSYLVRDGKLIRQHLPVMDTTAATAVVERELLDQVVSVSFRYMDESMSWSTVWPTAPLQGLPLLEQWRARPVAVEVTITLKDLGVLTRIIEVAG